MKYRLFLLSSFFMQWALCPARAQVVIDVDDENEVEVIHEDEDMGSFDFPEALTDANLDSLMNLYMSKTYLSEPGDCQTLSENPKFSDEVYIDRLKRMPTIMEMRYNDVVRSCIDRYVVRLRRQVSYMLGAANFYMPIFEQALDTYQLPLELNSQTCLNSCAMAGVLAMHIMAPHLMP